MKEDFFAGMVVAFLVSGFVVGVSAKIVCVHLFLFVVLLIGVASFLDDYKN